MSMQAAVADAASDRRAPPTRRPLRRPGNEHGPTVQAAISKSAAPCIGFSAGVSRACGEVRHALKVCGVAVFNQGEELPQHRWRLG